MVRHARAQDSSPGQKDFDRELSQVGRASASRAGRELYGAYPNPELILCSPALRARDTAQILAEQLHFATDKVELVDDLYEASVRGLLTLASNLPPKYKSAMLVGHNPAMSYFAEYLSNAEIGSLRPGGAVLLHLDDLEWSEISEGSCKFVKYHEPDE